MKARALSNQFAEIITVRCSRPLYSSQPTHPHPPTTPDNQEPQTGQATRAHYPRTPTACHPHTHQRTRGGTHHQQTTTTTRPQQPTTAGVSSTPSTRQTNHPAQQCTTVSRPAFRESNPLGRPRPINGPDNHDQEATPTQLPILRKEVIQPHLPVRLPCYDFVPITSPTFDRSP